MSTLYYISVDGAAVEMGAANCRGLRLSRKSAAVSVAAWTQDVPFDTDPQWPYGTYVTLQRRVDGGSPEILFQGWITLAEGDGTADSEYISYAASDAWHHFEREVYRSSRKIIDSEGELRDILTGRALLCQAADGSRLSAAAMVSAVRAFASSIGITVGAGTYDAPVTPPWDEVVNRSLAETILRVLRWQPDAVCWIDHSTVPPTLNVTRRSNMTAVDIPLAACDECRVRACHELQVPGVEISFERSGAAGLTVSVQEAGDTAALGCARMTLPLEFEGAAANLQAEIKAVPLGDYTEVAWWQQMFPWLPSDAILSDVIMLPAAQDGFTNVLVAGQITQRMQDVNGLGASQHTISCTVETTVDGKTYTSKELSRSFTLTNASTKRYYGRPSPGWSEPEPAGLAAAFYAAAGALQYGGSLVIVESECAAGRSLLGKRVNVTGGLAAWAAMGAAVVGVEEEFDTGKTVVTLGPQQHLALQDLVELVRCARLRSSWTPLNPLSAGEPGEDDADVDPFAPSAESSESPGTLSALEIIDPET